MCEFEFEPTQLTINVSGLDIEKSVDSPWVKQYDDCVIVSHLFRNRTNLGDRFLVISLSGSALFWERVIIFICCLVLGGIGFSRYFLF